MKQVATTTTKTRLTRPAKPKTRPDRALFCRKAVGVGVAEWLGADICPAAEFVKVRVCPTVSTTGGGEVAGGKVDGVAKVNVDNVAEVNVDNVAELNVDEVAEVDVDDLAEVGADEVGEMDVGNVVEVDVFVDNEKVLLVKDVDELPADDVDDGLNVLLFESEVGVGAKLGKSTLIMPSCLPRKSWAIMKEKERRKRSKKKVKKRVGISGVALLNLP
jgi:hypothetical protein